MLETKVPFAKSRK